jgi:LPS-assembly protein
MNTQSTHRLRLVACLILTLLLMPLPQLRAQDTQEESDAPMDVQADSYEFEQESGWATARNNVHIVYRGMILEAEEVRLNVRTKDVEAAGDVYFYTLEDPDSPRLEQGIFWHGTQLTGNFDSGEFVLGEHRVLAGEWFEEGEAAEYHKSGEIVFHDVDVSTCEYLHLHDAHYRLHAKKVIYTPEGRLKIYHAIVRVGAVPVMYVPYMSWDTDEEGGNIQINPGYKGDWGAFLLLARRLRLGEKGETTFRLDLRSKRGIAIGNETQYVTERSTTDFLVYAMRDSEPPTTSDGFNRRFESEDNRYRLKAYHRHGLGENWTLRMNLDAMSDIDFLEEWFEDDFEAYRQPRSYVDLRYDAERYTFSVSARPRVNDFYTVVERLPEIRLDFPRQPLGGSGLYYEGQTSLAHLEMKWRDFDVERGPGLPDPTDYDSWRFDTLHMFYLPLRVRDTVQIVPRAGFRLTYYSDTSDTPVTSGDLISLFRVDDPDLEKIGIPIVNYDDKGGGVWRLTGEVGLEASTKFYRVWDKAQSDFWRVDGLRHIVEPFINYTYLADPSEDRDNLYFFDEIDRLIKQHFVRIGVNQRLQTRDPSGRKIYTLASMESYADFHLETGKGQDHLGEFVTRIKVNPRPELSFHGLIAADMNKPDLNRAEIGGSFGDAEILKVGLSYIYRRDYDSYTLTSMGSTLTDYTGEHLASLSFGRSHYIRLTFDFPVSRKMDGHIEYQYDLAERELARQIYQLTRDMHCWIGALRLEEDDGEVTLQLVLYLKAFPDIGADIGI